ncbi:MAG: glycosyltransferase family 4 protein [Sphingomonas sp.]
MTRTIDLNFMLALPLTDGGPAYTCQSFARTMQGEGLRSRIFTPLDRRTRLGEIPVEIGLPRGFSRLPLKLSGPVAQARIERRYLEACARRKDGAVAFMWGETSLSLARALARSEALVVREKYNCGKLTGLRILREAYGRLGVADALDETPYSPSHLQREKQVLDLADYVFCPSPQVNASLREIGIPDEKMIPTSYGFDPARLEGESRALPPADGPTFLFVGRICVRKGAHILLEAWRRAALPGGRLVLLGEMEPVIGTLYADVLARDDVEHHAFTRDVGSYYRSTDYFIFPSLEEGGPQVTYEAAFCGIPSLVTPMGAGAILRDGVEGVVLDTDEPDAWAAMLRGLDRGGEAYRAQAAAAHERSLEFSWERVGAQRRRALLDRLGIAPAREHAA